MAATPGLRSETRYLEDEAATLGYGEALAPRLPAGALVFLRGDLGAGKTTLVRGILRGLGHSGSVKSPTYTLLEPYALANCVVYHLDLYRIADSGELDFIGIDELLEGDALKLVEWPERGADRLPAPDVEVRMQVHGEGRRVDIVVHG